MEMTRQERLLAAIRRQPVDRVPYATYNLHPYADTPHTGDPTYAGLLERVRTTAGAFIKIGAAGAGEGLTRHRPERLESRTEGAGDARTVTRILHTPKGDLTSLVHAPENKPGMVTRPFICSDEDIARYMSIPYEPPVFDLAPVRRLYDAVGDRGIIALGFSDPMYAVAQLFDFEDFCIRCITDLPTILRFIDWAYERSGAHLRLLLAAAGDLPLILHTSGAEVCTPPMMSPALFPRLVTPYLQRLIAVAHEGHMLTTIHCHGHVREVFPEMVKTGVDLLEPIEPPEQGNIALAELMNQAEGRLCLMGHIQDQEFYTAAPGFMTRRVEAIARVVKGRTGYIMSPTCTPFEFPCSDVYRRNYLEWMEAAERLLA